MSEHLARLSLQFPPGEHTPSGMPWFFLHSNVCLNGRRADAAEKTLAAYLARLRGSCGTLPLEGMRQQSKVDGVLRISLVQVYTQLTVDGTVKHEGSCELRCRSRLYV
jgi:hypothetical protein